MCFRPPEFKKLMTMCPECKTYNPPALKKCKKCGAELPLQQNTDDGAKKDS